MLTTPEEDWGIAHELAHQWWGKLRDMRRLDALLVERGDHDVHGGGLEGASLGRPAYDRSWRSCSVARTRRRPRGSMFRSRIRGPIPLSGFGARSPTRRAPSSWIDCDASLATRCSGARCSVTHDRYAGGVVESRDFQRAVEQESGRDLQALFANGFPDGNRLQPLIERRRRSARTSEASARRAESVGPG